MTRISGALVLALAVAWRPASIAGQGPATSPPAGAKPVVGKPWTAPRAADGHPDLQGTWNDSSATPLERPREFAGREFLTDAEVAAVEQRAGDRGLTQSPTASIHPVWWLDYGTKVVDTHRTSLIVDPPDGRVPALTPEAQKREAARRAEAASHGPLDAPENLNTWERCLARALPEAMLPGPYNSNIQIVQTPGYVVILMEMIHDARIVPLDDRPHLPGTIRTWHGDPRGHWEGDTLVVETTNFSDKTSYRGSDAQLRLVERFTRTGPDAIQYRVTVEDPTTWTRPWTAEVPMIRSEGELYEYTCHEGNYGMKNGLSNARDEERRKGPQ